MCSSDLITAPVSRSTRRVSVLPTTARRARDTTTASSDYETAIGFYNVLNSGNANLTNEPLKPKSVTLSRTDLIAFQYGQLIVR